MVVLGEVQDMPAAFQVCECGPFMRQQEKIQERLKEMPPTLALPSEAQQ